MTDKHPNGVDDGYDTSRGLGPNLLELSRDIGFDTAEKELPDLLKAIGKPQYSRMKIRIEPITELATDTASRWNQPARKEWVDDYDWNRIWGKYKDKPNGFGVAVWVDQPDGKSVLAGMAAGSFYDDREPRRLDLDYIESVKKDEQPIPGAFRFIAASAALRTVQTVGVLHDMTAEIAARPDLPAHKALSARLDNLQRQVQRGTTGQPTEMRFVDYNPGSEAIFNAMGFKSSGGKTDEQGYEYASMTVDPALPPAAQLQYGKPAFRNIPKI